MSRLGKLTKLITSLTSEAIENHIGDAEKCALDSINPGVDEDKPIRAKLSITVDWEVEADRPKPKVKASYSVRKTEEYSSDEDLNQLEMFAPVTTKNEGDNNDE